MGYKDTFISVAPDTKAEQGIEPKPRGNKETIPQIEYRLLVSRPYQFTQDELTFRTRLIRQGIEFDDLSDDEREDLWAELFSKGQPCLRASSLTKSNGWGVHYDSIGRIAIYPMDTTDYAELSGRKDLKQIPSMRSSKK